MIKLVVIKFEDSKTFRIKADDLKKIDKIVKKNPDIFANRSHFIRASIIRHFRFFKDSGKLKDRM